MNVGELLRNFVEEHEKNEKEVSLKSLNEYIESSLLEIFKKKSSLGYDNVTFHNESEVYDQLVQVSKEYGWGCLVDYFNEMDMLMFRGNGSYVRISWET